MNNRFESTCNRSSSALGSLTPIYTSSSRKRPRTTKTPLPPVTPFTTTNTPTTNPKLSLTNYQTSIFSKILTSSVYSYDTSTVDRICRSSSSIKSRCSELELLIDSLFSSSCLPPSIRSSFLIPRSHSDYTLRFVEDIRLHSILVKHCNRIHLLRESLLVLSNLIGSLRKQKPLSLLFPFSNELHLCIIAISTALNNLKTTFKDGFFVIYSGDLMDEMYDRFSIEVVKSQPNFEQQSVIETGILSLFSCIDVSSSVDSKLVNAIEYIKSQEMACNNALDHSCSLLLLSLPTYSSLPRPLSAGRPMFADVALDVDWEQPVLQSHDKNVQTDVESKVE
ncbi:hypothetical protein RCL1_003520 [Eukaryota sp. TZLM3-RCL]